MPGSGLCTWCGGPVADDDGFRAYEPASERRATFCRLEHVVPWVIKGARWEPGPMDEEGVDGGPDASCSFCDAGVGEARIVLVRRRGIHRIPDTFCDAEHLGAWAKAGGRWATSA